jgi:hypothetical protein
MVRRILLLSLQQAMRSVTLVLFPLAFISLFAWATAGSATGNTSDPVKAALWLWLGMHLVPFKLAIAPNYVSGALSYLPIGAAIFPFLAVRNSFRKLVSEVRQERAGRIFFLGWYGLFAAGISLISTSHGVKSNWYSASIFSLVIAGLATVNYQNPFLKFIKFPFYLLISLWGIGTLAVGFSLLAHFRIVKDLTVVIQPGWVGGALFLLIQLLYLPNLAISALSYLFGLGFSLGNQTHISPRDFSLHQIPAIPLVGALPTGKHPFLIYFLVIALALALLAIIKINQVGSGLVLRQITWLKVSAGVTILCSIMGFLDSGALITKQMDPVGIVWWKFGIGALSMMFFAGIIGQYLPAGFRKWRQRV